MGRWLVVVGLMAGIGSLSGAQPQKPIVADYAAAMVGPLPASLAVDPFYKKHADALGIPVLSSQKVPDAALLMGVCCASQRPA